MIVLLLLCSGLQAAPQYQGQFTSAVQTEAVIEKSFTATGTFTVTQTPTNTPTVTVTPGPRLVRISSAGDSSVAGSSYTPRLPMELESASLGKQMGGVGLDQSSFGDTAHWPYADCRFGIPATSQGTLDQVAQFTTDNFPAPITNKDVWLVGPYHPECTGTLDTVAFKARIHAIAVSITGVSSNVQIFICTAYAQPAFAICDAGMNTALAETVTTLQGEGYSNVHLLDIAGHFPSPDLVADGLHPTLAFNNAIGAYEADQIFSVLYP